MSLNNEGVTILWALRSPCNLRCKYCYFNIDEENIKYEGKNNINLSYNPFKDLRFEDIISFISSFNDGVVKRVFIAGGEPLIWSNTIGIIKALKKAGCEVVICTNGLPLLDKELCCELVESGVDGVSVSLDSYEPEYNDYLRVDKSGRGWHGVVKGIKQLLDVRRCDSKLKVGIYSVITKNNISHIEKTYEFVSNIGADYYIIQPISLDNKHNLYSKLSLNESHYDILKNILLKLENKEGHIKFCNHYYLKLFLKTLKKESFFEQECFAGDNLFFIKPDGSVWDCPSSYLLPGQSIDEAKTIINYTAQSLFTTNKGKTKCTHCSNDCINMWQLMDFDTILHN